MMENIKIGDTVKLKHTRENAIVKEIYPDGMLLVLPYGEIEAIPVDAEHLLDKKMSPQLPPREKHGYDTHIPFETYGFTHSFLHAVPREDLGGIRYFELYLANILKEKVALNCQLLVDNLPLYKGIKIIQGRAFNYLSAFKYDDLSTEILMEGDLRVLNPNGMGPAEDFSIRIKAARFFKNYNKFQGLPLEGHSFEIVGKKIAPESEDLRSYSLAKTEELKETHERKRQESAPSIGNVYHPKRLATFKAEIDLHMEALGKDPKTMTAGQIIKLQLEAFDRYLEEAIALRADRFFAIHGVGKGKLKNEIAARLLRHPQVKTFVNEWHHKYGYGATEVILNLF
jgi:hypothetical protein